MQELAIASVPMQEYRQLYTPAQGLQHGTLFKELDLPFAPQTCRKGGAGDGSNRKSHCRSGICR